jgi:hypothetical protein
LIYLNYAAEKPKLFKILFSDLNSYSKSHDLPVSDIYAFQLFENFVSAVIPENVPKSRYREITISCWALLHGFATLHMDKRLETVNYKKEHAIDAVITLANTAYVTNRKQ